MPYVSEATRFINDLLEKNPQIVEQQKRNRSTWYDRPQDLETWREYRNATVAQPAYVYFPIPGKKEAEP